MFSRKRKRLAGPVKSSLKRPVQQGRFPFSGTAHQCLDLNACCQPLIALLDQTLDVSLTNVELTVLGEVDGSGEMCKQTVCDLVQTNLPVFRLDLTSVFQYANVDEEIGRWFQAASQIDVGPLTLVGGQKIAHMSSSLSVRTRWLTRRAHAGSSRELTSRLSSRTSRTTVRTSSVCTSLLPTSPYIVVVRVEIWPIGGSRETRRTRLRTRS
ncbi:hypothetical protein KCU85_g37, partial [Aureobasidium melanogenum]